MFEYQRINGFTILSNEIDHLLKHIIDCPIEEQQWQRGMVPQMMEAHLLNADKRIAVDVGASYGWVTIPLSTYYDQVHSFEILPQVREALILNTEDKLNIFIHPYGIGDVDTSVDVNIPEPYTTGGASVVAQVGQYPIKPLDSFPFEIIDLLKIDVEGYEYNVLRGAEQTLLRCKPFIVMEMFTTRSKAHLDNRMKCLGFLKSLGYSVVDVRSDDWYLIHDKCL